MCYESGFGFGFIECFTTTFLQTHHSLLAKLGRDMKVGLGYDIII